MNPETATAAEMDAAKTRFVCGTCPPELQGRRCPLTWRDCVLVHGGSYATTAASHGPPSSILLSPLAAADVRQREEPDDYSHAHAWSCTLCNDYLPFLGFHKRVKEHIVLKHAIEQPIEGEHLIHFKGPELPRRRRVLLSVERTPRTFPMQPLCACRPTSCQALSQACDTGACSGSPSGSVRRRVDGGGPPDAARNCGLIRGTNRMDRKLNLPSNRTFGVQRWSSEMHIPQIHRSLVS
ncbi:hypothetical protein B0H14DRAFT_3878441 [Mycena olivaceomarginata]|nr:hypothetical protein B0H14DRAFT_3878441 [Mycena olivaceomarginata]